jgi:hypothetical protein
MSVKHEDGEGERRGETVLMMGSAGSFGTVLDTVDEDLGFAEALQIFGTAV